MMHEPFLTTLPDKHPLEPVPELYFATVRALGAPTQETVIDPLEKTLTEVNFGHSSIKLSDLFATIPSLFDLLPSSTTSLAGSYEKLMTCGDTLRSARGDGGALAVEAIAHLHNTVRVDERKKIRPRSKQIGLAYIFRNLLHPREIERLRKLYDRQLFVISVFAPENFRVDHLADKLARKTGKKLEALRSPAQLLVEREAGRAHADDIRVDPERLKMRKYLLNIEATFPHGDLFLDASDPEATRAQVERFVRLIFRHPFHTPTYAEIGMAEAFGAALESGNIARPVGAAICSPTGELLVTGTNDVPKSGGGVYREGDKPDNRDHVKPPQGVWGYDSSDDHRRKILSNFLRHLLADPEWMKRLCHGRSGENLAKELLARVPNDQGADLEDVGGYHHHIVDYERLINKLIASPVVSNSEFFDIIEYGRTLHAEMDAITSAARKGVAIRGATLYCTTLPCHECARLIIGSGIQRVVFIEPYEKSRAYELYRSEISFTTLSESLRTLSPDTVHFIPYVGISPRRFQELFAWVPRKKNDLPGAFRTLSGEIVDWDAQQLELGKIAPKLRRRAVDPVPPIIRERIVSPSAFFSEERFRDLYAHEGLMLNDALSGNGS